MFRDITVQRSTVRYNEQVEKKQVSNTHVKRRERRNNMVELPAMTERQSILHERKRMKYNDQVKMKQVYNEQVKKKQVIWYGRKDLSEKKAVRKNHGTVEKSCSKKRQVENSTVQYSTVQYSTVQYSTVQYSTVQYSTVRT